jgi:hypothetical protein
MAARKLPHARPTMYAAQERPRNHTSSISAAAPRAQNAWKTRQWAGEDSARSAAASARRSMTGVLAPSTTIMSTTMVAAAGNASKTRHWDGASSARSHLVTPSTTARARPAAALHPSRPPPCLVNVAKVATHPRWTRSTNPRPRQTPAQTR